MVVVNSAKEVLLRALEAIEEIEGEMEAEVKHVAVIYSVYESRDGRVVENGGWCTSDEPAWITASMLRRSARAIEDSVGPEDDDED